MKSSQESGRNPDPAPGDVTEAELVEAALDALHIIDEDVYTGPGAVTLKQIMATKNVSEKTARRRGEAAVARGDLVAVMVMSQDSIGRQTRQRAYVVRAVYDEWAANRE